MRQYYSITAHPSSEPLTYQEACDQLRVDSGDDEEYIMSLIGVSRKYIEDTTGRVCMRQSITMISDCIERIVSIYRSPVKSITSVKYLPYDGGSIVTMDPSSYRLISVDGVSCVLFPGDIPSIAESPDAVQIEFVAGEIESTLIDKTIIQSIKLMVSHLYQSRVPVGAKVYDIPYTMRTLIENLKVGGFTA